MHSTSTLFGASPLTNILAIVHISTESVFWNSTSESSRKEDRTEMGVYYTFLM